MRASTCLALIGLLAAACTDREEHHRFTAEQLAWQPYQPGQLLRFGNRATTAVRTYRVTSVADSEYQPYTGVNFTFFPSRKRYYQEQQAQVQRTDTASAYQVPVVALSFDYNGSFSPPAGAAADTYAAVAELHWIGFNGRTLPLDALNSGTPLDTTTLPGVRVYAGLALGPATYPQVVRLGQFPPAPSLAVPALYYAKGVGVVGFEDRKTGLWYRLP